MMNPVRPALLAALVMGLSGLFASASAELAAPYDPVARAIALGLTPEAVDAAFDRALAQAETCDPVAIALQTMACTPSDVATLDQTALPPLES